MGPLGTLFSAIDTTKRKLGDLFSSPVQSAQQMVGYANDRARSLNELTSGAAQEMKQGLLSGGSTYGPKSQQLTQTIADAYNPMGMVVWHGSPHTFNKFDASKIGTGEGAQAYGHGLYVAESPDVAMQYKDVLRDEFGIKKMQEKFAQMEDRLANWTGKGGPKRAERLENLTEAVKSRLNEKLTGDTNSLYKIDLPDEHIAKMLDWDKPLSQQQPDVALALEMLRDSARKSFPDIASGDPTGRGIYSAYQAHRGGNQAAASEKLRELGIPGIRYLDGGSRGTGAGTSNFVVFPGNEHLLQILERNGQLLK